MSEDRFATDGPGAERFGSVAAVLANAGRACVVRGDCMELGTLIPESSIDALVTDPPSGISFMGKAWDGDKGGRDQWVQWLCERMRLAFHLLKPGAHALVWAIPRTSHWTATAIENAGFEIRDVGIHLFGSGFPKSMDVSKAIDDALGAERVVTGQHDSPLPGAGGVYAQDAWSQMAREERVPRHDVPATEEAARWQGWGTALKPAAEHWILARKPLAGTVARNVLEHGTGGLNIEACRIGTTGSMRAMPGEPPSYKNLIYGRGMGGVPRNPDAVCGRWPAHVTLDEEAAEMLDEQSGVQKDGVATNHNRKAGVVPQGYVYEGGWKARTEDVGYGGGGGASRYFYVAKPARSEKETGLRHLEPRTGTEITGRAEDSAGINHPRAGAGARSGARNSHPTVKPVELMRWLCKLITPPGGVVLDMFAGSGTTLVAALDEDFRAIGCELDLEGEYLPILIGRVTEALGRHKQIELFGGM